MCRQHATVEHHRRGDIRLTEGPDAHGISSVADIGADGGTEEGCPR